MFDNIAKEWDSEKRIERAKLIANEMLENVDIDSNYKGIKETKDKNVEYSLFIARGRK